VRDTKVKNRDSSVPRTKLDRIEEMSYVKKLEITIGLLVNVLPMSKFRKNVLPMSKFRKSMSMTGLIYSDE